MTYAGSSAGIMLVLKTGRLILIGSRRLLALRNRMMVRALLAFHGNNIMVSSAHRLHRNRNSQRVAAEQRQPDGYNDRNEFSDGTWHMRSLAKLGSPVKYQTRDQSDLPGQTKFA